MDLRIPILNISTPPKEEAEAEADAEGASDLDQDKNIISRGSTDTLDSQRVNVNADITINIDDTDDQSLNTDLASVALSRANSNINNLAVRKQSFDSSSIFTSSFRQSFDDFASGSGGLPLLGNNHLSLQSYSPLGANSIYELVADVDAKQRRQSSLKANPNQRTSTKGGVDISKPTQMDIPPVTIPKVTKADKEVLKQYLNDVDGEFERFNSNKKLTSSSLRKISKLEAELSTTAAVDELDVIPKVYFQEEFNLDDPRVFKQVLEGFKLRHLNQENSLQEKLSYYLDTIEVHLVNEISRSSGSFFDALNDLSGIQSKNLGAMRSIASLKEDLSKLREGKVNAGLRKCQLLKKKENVGKLEQVLLQMTTIKQGLATAEAKFYESEYEQCLDKLDEVQGLIEGKDATFNSNAWPHPLTNLNLLPALQPVHKSIRSLKLKVGGSYTKLFVDYLVYDLRSHYEELNHGELFKGLVENSSSSGSGSGGKTSSIRQEFKDGLAKYLEGLVRCEVIPEALIQYQNQVLTEMKNVVRVYLPNEDNIDKIRISTGSGSVSSVTSATNTNTKAGGAPASLGQLIKSLTPGEFEYVLVQIMTTCLEGFKRLKIHQKLLLELTLNSNSNKITSVFSNDLVASLDITPAINKSIEIVQLRIGKVLKVRVDLNSMLRFDYFLRLFFINSSFVNSCESISGMTFKELPFVLNEQVKGFNSTTFANCKGKCVHSVDQEHWKPAIVELELQEVVRKITEKAKLDPESQWKRALLEFISSTGNTDSLSPTAKTTTSTAASGIAATDEAETEPTQQKSHRRSLVVGDKMFVASQTLLTYIQIVQETLIISSNLPHLSATYEQFTLDLTRTFTARIAQNITLKEGRLNTESVNLSVVGETLDCVLEFLLFVRLWFDDQRFGEEYDRVMGVVRALKSKIDGASMMRMQE